MVVRQPRVIDSKVLFCGFTSQELKPLGGLIETGQLTIEKAQSLGDLEGFSPQSVATLVVNLDWIVQIGREAIKSITERYLSCAKIFVCDNHNREQLLDLFDQLEAFRVIDKQLPVEGWRDVILAGLKEHENLAFQRGLLREVSRQNKELEALNQDLESMVAERTFHIEISNEEEKEKVNKMRTLVRFGKELNGLSSFEEILQLVRRETRKFHKLGDPILAFSVAPNKTKFIYFRSGQTVRVEHRIKLNLNEGFNVNNPQLSRELANLFGRPFVKVIGVSLGKSARGAIMVEHSLSDDEIDAFKEFFGARIQSLGIAVERILLEDEMTMSSFRWEKTFDGILDPVAIVDIEFNLLRSNKKFSDRVVKRKCYQNFVNASKMCDNCPVPQALESGQPVTAQLRLKERLYQVHSYPIFLSSSVKATNVVNHYVDITQSRELYSRMIQSEKVSAIGLLAGNIAHELNNPLTGIRALSQVLLTEVSPQEALFQDLVEIEKAAARSQGIIKDLLEFSTGSASGLQEVTADELVEKTMPLLKTALKNHRSVVNLNSRDSKVCVQPHLVQQVVFNLVNNACQAMREQGQITLSTIESNLGDHAGVLVRVKDSGPGIDEAQQKRIFEPFFTTKKEGAGTGLGLSMARSVIEGLGGQIGVKSEPGHGAEFWFWLPSVGESQ